MNGGLALYILKRLLWAIPILFGVTVLSFSLLNVVPGDPVDLMLGDQASPTDREALRRQLGLDLPLREKLQKSMLGFLRGDLGKSMQSRRPVATEILERLPATAELAFASMILAILIGIPAGVLAAVKRQTWIDRAVRLIGLIGLSMPAFWLAPLLILLFALKLDWFPVSERGDLWHLALPSLTLAFALASVLSQVTRAAVIEVLGEEYMRVARAKGCGEGRLWFKHALSNALMPIITVLGLQFGAVLTGTVIVETIYDWPGLGTLLYGAIQSRNYPVVQGCLIVISLIYVSVNIVADLAYAAVNPKVRFDEAR